VWRDPADQPQFARGAVVAIGVFDGVHRGHQALLELARSEADGRNLPLVVVTFQPHPLAVVRPGSEPPQLATIRHRVELLAAAGADAVHLLEFTTDLSRTEPADWVRATLAPMPARAVVVGENFRFGHQAAGDVALLRSLGDEHGFDVLPVPLLADPADGPVWSSSRIRAALAEGDLATVADGLGRPHTVEGQVVQGDQRGRELGYPTANLNPAAAGYGGPVALPKDGVYAGWLVLNPHRPGMAHLPAAVSVGTNPTFEGSGERRIEAYVLDRDDLWLYQQLVAVEFIERLRDQASFADVEELVAQMGLDVRRTRQVLGR
jgi:riboflavin kinase/FMN adenylyltransferase